MTRSTVEGVIHKLTVDEFVDCTNTPVTCCGEIFQVHNVEITHVTLTTPTHGQPVITRRIFHIWPTRIQNLKSLALAVLEICGVKF